MAIAGIEGLAQGFMQGMALKRQNDRQDVLDAQNLERFSMDKERFATQQAASAFELQNAQTNAANAAMDRTRALGIQKIGDDVDAQLRGIFAHDDESDQYLAYQNMVNERGADGAFTVDPKTNKVLLDKEGNATWTNKKDGTTKKTNMYMITGRLFDQKDPTAKITQQRALTADIAKEKRDVVNSIAKDAPKLASAERISNADNASREQQIKLQLQYKTKQEKDAAISVFSPYISSARQIFRNNKLSAEDLHNMKRDLSKDGFIQEGVRSFNAANASKQLTPEQIKAAQREVTSLADTLYGTGGATTSGTDTYDSPSQGKLVPIGLEGEAGAIELNDRQPVSVEKPSAVKSSTDKPATPKSLTVPRPSSSTTPAKTYKGNAGTMLPGDYLAALGVAIKNGMPVMPPPKQYPQGTTFFGNNANPLDQTIKLGTK